MTKKNKILFLMVLLLFAMTEISVAQEVLTGLTKNPELLNAKKQKKSSTKGGSNDEIRLPMREDFSKPVLFPRQDIWADKNVFINTSYAINPPSIGVATFDAMDSHGMVYGYMGSFSAVADTLTTNNIRLDSVFYGIPKKIWPVDSVYLSFFVQPQGCGAAPMSGDSLVLQFYNPKDTVWKSVWHIDGMSFDAFRNQYDTSFLQVMVAITDSDYFAPNFKFRFYNYARIPSPDKPSWRSGLHSHWNLDYIILEANRSFDDTSYSDIAIQNAHTSILKDYQQMTWKQFQAAPSASLQTGYSIGFKNLDNSTILKNVSQYFYIYDLYNNSIVDQANPNPSVISVNPQAYITYTPNCLNCSLTASAPKYPDFRVLYNVITNSAIPDINKDNDTLAFYQRFYNYLSYDDGVPEAGYGLSTNGGKLAYKFKLNAPDTLQSIQMYFNQTLGNANQQYFYLTVWDDNNGRPGNVIYEKSGKRPEFESRLFKFHTYVLDNELPVSGTFYVGWRQTTKDNLNVGFDISNDKSNNVFYNVSGIWYNSSFKGAPMIRPILGQEKYAHVGIENKITKKVEKTIVNVFPNPNNTSWLNVEIIDNEVVNGDYRIAIYSLQGQILYSEEYKSKINIESLSRGVYLLRIENKFKQINEVKKIIIN